MIDFSNGGRLVESRAELPDFRNVERLYLDFETTSGDPKLKSLNPWHNCKILGIAITVDDEPHAWYVPIRHQAQNVEYTATRMWLIDILATAKKWINHNIKYDAHCCALEGVSFKCELVDTLTLAKIIDSDRLTKGGYSLTALSNAMLDEDNTVYERRIKEYLRVAKSKDYGDVPADIMAVYACEDVLTTRRLFKYLDRSCPDQCRKVWNTEIDLTSVLFDIERHGMRIDRAELKQTELRTLHQMLTIEEKLHVLTGTIIRPHTNTDCYELLCGKYGLPVLGWTEKHEPSFDKAALTSYLQHPLATEEVKAIVELIRKYRKVHTLHGMFIMPYQKLAVNGYVHSFYNQSVRTGRMSARNPNPQQLSSAAKALIHPDPNHWLMSWDYSQIEFRFMVHYMKNKAAIEAYCNDPDTDFHVWVAEMCGVPRRPAKNINFAMGFGAGREKVLTMLQLDADLMNLTMKEARGNAAQFNQLNQARARGVYQKYHNALPELRLTSHRASMSAVARGYVFNAYGRRRHLPHFAAFRGFNSVIQGSAADLMKEAVVRTSPRFNPIIRSAGVSQVAVVHDELLLDVPEPDNPALLVELTTTMEQPSIDLRVPIRVVAGQSDQNWADMAEIDLDGVRPV